jgi:hypothetical protein
MYLTKEDFAKGVCKNGHPITSTSYGTMANLKGDKAFRCRPCRNEQRQQWVKANPEDAHRLKLTTHLRQRYGIQSIEERDAILASQGNACAMCGRTDCTWGGKGFQNVWHVDHDPSKPRTHRGILCAACNTALGRLEPILGRVLEYLEKFK